MAKTLFIVNPNAGRTRAVWREIEPKLGMWLSDYRTVMTRSPEDVIDTLDQARMDEIDRIITVGGDGTNKVMVNAIMEHRTKFPDHDLIFGSIPAGTGRDFARGVGLPLKTIKAAEYVLTEAQAQWIDLGVAEFDNEKHYFLNAANAGIANDVALRVERSNKRPWTFLVSVISSLAGYQPETVRITLDGEQWFEGNIYVMAVANGRSIGQGILIAPDAIIDDGYFDVVIAEEMPFFDLVKAFPSIYTGKHITHPKVKVQRAKQIEIVSPMNQKIGMDLDGEPSDGATGIRYEIIPSALQMLL